MKALSLAWGTFLKVVNKLTSSSVFWYAVFGAAAFYAYKRLTTPKEETFLELPLPNSGSGLPKDWNPNPLVEEFHAYFDSWFGNSDDLRDAYIKALSLTNDQFHLLVQTYNAKYGKKDAATLWSRVTSWKKILFSWNGDQQARMEQRMIALKLNY
ncbi:hypothetical protein GOQ04_25585 [Emticicia sp. ODNR4P]|nr:hypothetical protein [Emticicia sp. ODNR4P]